MLGSWTRIRAAQGVAQAARAGRVGGRPLQLQARTVTSSSSTSKQRSAQPLVSSSKFFNAKRPLAPSQQLVNARTRALSTQSFFAFFGRHRYLSITLRLIGSTVFGLGVVLAAILGHDALTYEERHIDRVPVNPLSLHPRVGGKKNLPILEVNLGGEEDEEKIEMGKKPRLVIVGGGWGAVALLQTLPPTEYNVTLISPQTYFAFTPLLPSACVGTVEPRSLVEPLRKLVARVRGHYLMGAAVDLDMGERLIEVDVGDGKRCYVPYDKLVIAVGSSSNTHGVKGLEHCFQLKTVPDAQQIRRRVMNNLETASLPTTSPEERKRLLSFVVCGGGPTGVEFAAELADMMSEDVLNYFPKLLRNELSLTVIQSRDHILNTYSEKISQYAEKRFKRSEIDVVINARVQEVTEDKVIISVKDPKDKDAKPEIKEIQAGFVLWSTGIAMNPFVKRLVELLPNQFHSKAVEVDSHLRVQGAPSGTVYCIGDAATIETNLVDHLMELFAKFDSNKDNKIDYKEWCQLTEHIKERFPLAEKSFVKIREIFDKYDTDNDEALSLNEVATLFMDISRKVTTLPATAQVASQQGKYLGGKFAKLAKQHRVLQANDLPGDDDEAYYKPFRYLHLGSLAYIGNSAVFDFNGYSFAGGLMAMYAWRSIYWSEQASLRTRVLLMIDWIKRGIFGRDLSKF